MMSYFKQKITMGHLSYKSLQLLVMSIGNLFRKTINSLRNFQLAGNKILIIIYSMGKVGSRTVRSTLISEFKNLNVFQVHFLSDKWIDRNKDFSWNKRKIRNAELIKDFVKVHPNHRIKIISLVREPISRDISNIFENPHLFFHGEQIEKMPFEEFYSKLPKLKHNYCLEWFDNEFKEYLGFDIYEHAFNKEEGYSIYEHNNKDILIIKLEKMNECFQKAFYKFTGYHLRRLHVSNESANKITKDLSLRLKEVYREPERDLRSVYSSKYVQHFYTKDEIENFMRRWSE